MLKEGTTIYFYVQGYLMRGKAVHIQGDEQAYTFHIEGYGACAGPHVLHSSQLHHTLFLSEEEAKLYQNIEAAYLENTF